MSKRVSVGSKWAKPLKLSLMLFRPELSLLLFRPELSLTVINDAKG